VRCNPRKHKVTSRNFHLQAISTDATMQATSGRRIVRPVLTLLLALLGHHACAAAPSLSSWFDSAAAIEPWIIERQTELHRIPELMFDTPKTYAALEQHLTGIGVKHRYHQQALVKICAYR
jgi:hypothetical protein